MTVITAEFFDGLSCCDSVQSFAALIELQHFTNCTNKKWSAKLILRLLKNESSLRMWSANSLFTIRRISCGRIVLFATPVAITRNSRLKTLRELSYSYLSTKHVASLAKHVAVENFLTLSVLYDGYTEFILEVIITSEVLQPWKFLHILRNRRRTQICQNVDFLQMPFRLCFFSNYHSQTNMWQGTFLGFPKVCIWYVRVVLKRLRTAPTLASYFLLYFLAFNWTCAS